MSKNHSFLDTVDQIVTDGVKRGILHLTNEDAKLKGNLLRLNSKEVVNFGSCSYLGLEFDSRLIDGACQAVKNFGTQFSESRAYVSLSLYKKLEKKFEEIFEAPVIVTPTTTLGHIACIPVLVSDKDAVIIDHQVHSSVQNAVSIVKSKGTYTELIRPNRMDLLEERIKELKKKYDKIWYMADGIYSMFGDECPVEKVEELLNRYPEFHFYVDDAHGMSCFGKNGRGFVLSKIKIHPRMVVATSLAKAFATGGAVLIFPDKETARRVRTCGGPLITSGPLQPATLGAAIASANIHLSAEITVLQDELQEKIKYVRILLKKYQLPVISYANSAVFFIAVSLPKIGYKLIEKMQDSGFYLNLGIFPAVPMKNTGVRFTITRLHTFKQIDEMLKNLNTHFHQTLKEESLSLENIHKAFKFHSLNSESKVTKLDDLDSENEFKIELYQEIEKIDPTEWNSKMNGKGSFDYNGLIFLQRSFSENILPENNWKFEYLIIRDKNGEIVVCTFFTSCLWKEDMLSPNEISRLIEEKRSNDPYLFTSTILMTGSLLTEGEHLYIDYESKHWRNALKIFFKALSELQEKHNASTVMIRDFEAGNEKLDTFFIEEGYFRIQMPDSNYLSKTQEYSETNFIERLSPRSKKHLRQEILKHEHKFEYNLVNSAKPEEIKHWYELYLQVKNRSLELNTFTLPFNLFIEMLKDPNWEISTLKFNKKFYPNGSDFPVAVMFNYISGNTSNFMLIGIDYAYQKEFHCYRQALYQVIKYQLKLGRDKINLGFSASFEKRKLGAVQKATCAYMQMKDNFNMQYLSELQESKKQPVFI